MIQTTAPTGAARDTVAPLGHMEMEERPIPAPNAINVRPIAAVTTAPAKTAAQETPEASDSPACVGTGRTSRSSGAEVPRYVLIVDLSCLASCEPDPTQ
jgi:hypothetical protein